MQKNVIEIDEVKKNDAQLNCLFIANANNIKKCSHSTTKFFTKHFNRHLFFMHELLSCIIFSVD